MSIDTSKGYVAFPRGLTGWEWYSDVNTSRVYFHLLLTANWEAKKWHGIVINPGDKITSFAHLAEETNLSVRAVRTAVDHLIATNYLSVKTTNKFSVITVNNWGLITGADRQTISERQADNRLGASCSQKGDKQNDKQKPKISSEETIDFCLHQEKATSKMTNDRQTSDKQPTTTKPLKPLEPLKQSSSSKSPSEADDEDAPAGATTETTISPESFWMENGLGKSITPSLKERLTEYRSQGVEDALIVQAMRETAEHNATAPLPYMRKVLDQAVAAGELTLDAWQARHRAYRPKGRVDRPEPSGNDFLRDAADRPRRLKRKG